jgi:chitinase
MRAQPPVVARGEAATITWQAENASNCTASGGWSGGRPVGGSVSTGALTAAAEYRLSCSSVGSSGALAQVTVDVRQTQPIRLSFTAKPQRVSRGGSAELQWRAQNADSCVAEGGWQGARSRAGSFETGRLDRTVSYTIRCSNADYEEVAILQVRVNRFALEWRPPSRNVDGSLARDIDGYRVYWGKRRGHYTGSVTISSPDVTRWEPDLGPGTYYFAVSAFDRAGNESEKSAPLRKVID